MAEALGLRGALRAFTLAAVFGVACHPDGSRTPIDQTASRAVLSAPTPSKDLEAAPTSDSPPHGKSPSWSDEADTTPFPGLQRVTVEPSFGMPVPCNLWCRGNADGFVVVA